MLTTKVIGIFGSFLLYSALFVFLPLALNVSIDNIVKINVVTGTVIVGAVFCVVAMCRWMDGKK
jgi:hypothetical protein